MPVLAFNGEADGYSLQWGFGTGTAYTHWDDADDAESISENTAGQIHAMKRTTNPIVPDVESFSAVQVITRANNDNPGTATSYRSLVRVGGSNSVSSDISVPQDDTTWVDTTKDFVSSRPGGGSWVKEDFDDIEWGVEHRSTQGTGQMNVSRGYMSIDFETTDDGFAYLVSCWLPPLLGLASHALLTRELVGALGSMTLMPSTRAEIKAIKWALLRRPGFAM